ncbi:unnamed protein product [Diatraea saccharalis]|uniref:Tetraspanin n=1 Tax=Diatraea saccharalis TaxID=40085 RepID=A0A9N9R5Q7_9NEOP|nr:unnamed protein product [Diatraea saccharalis]
MASAHKPISTILNVLQTILSVILAGISIWFFIELKSLTDLRNRDRYLLDFSVYWPQVLPWIFFVISVFVICVSLCGIYGACSGRKAAVITYITFLSIVIVAAFAAGVMGLVCGDTKSTDDFVSETVRDAYSQMKVRKDIIVAFGKLESRLRCCGTSGASDYTSGKIPDSCCDKNELVECENSASRRLGCVEVVVPYSRMFIRYTSIGSIAIAVVCLASLIVAILLLRSSRSKKDRLKSEAEKEPLKLPL